MLKDIEILPVYDSATSSLIDDLIIPLLGEAIQYTRGVGFFSSGWLRVAALGLTQLIENGGKAQIVTSPILAEEDWKALQLGVSAIEDNELRRILERNIADLAESLQKETLNTLAWLVADSLVEFRFAIPRPGFSDGDYHDKVGLITDSVGNSVAFHGSFNDSIKGTLNGEAFSVFCSWKDGQSLYVDKHRERLTDLWENKSRQFRVFTLPESVKANFIRLRSTLERPYVLSKVATCRRTPQGSLYCPIALRPYQEAAIDAWCAANHRGILEMATGSGKTYTALSAAARMYQSGQRLAILILVPQIHLVAQWRDHCRAFNLEPIECHSAVNNWKGRLLSQVQNFRAHIIHSMCVVVVHRTASLSDFQKIARGLPFEHTMVIADEVHWLGAQEMRKALLGDVRMRLGLSATPSRWYDPEGTQVIMDYFGATCFEFPLSEAIDRGFLVPYFYYPILCELTLDEMDEYGRLTGQIQRLFKNKHASEPSDDDQLRRLLLMRARITWLAQSKPAVLSSLIEELIHKSVVTEKDMRGLLVYCAPGSHRDFLQILANYGLRCHEFVHTVDNAKRAEVLGRFADGFLQALVAIKCLDEGVDIPATKTTVITASTSNPREYVQRRGRVLRPSTGKRDAAIYDFIVVPPFDYNDLDVGRSILRKEMARFVEFSKLSLNEFDARDRLRDILDKYEILDCLDCQGWEIQRSITLEHSEDLDGECPYV